MFIIRIKFFLISLVLLFHYFEQKDSSEREDGETEAELDEAAGVGCNQTQLVKMSEENETKRIIKRSIKKWISS